MTTLADLYDADKRVTSSLVRRMAETYPIPHPLHNVQYADGIRPCTHSKRHGKWEPCASEGIAR